MYLLKIGGRYINYSHVEEFVVYPGKVKIQFSTGNVTTLTGKRAEKLREWLEHGEGLSYVDLRVTRLLPAKLPPGHIGKSVVSNLPAGKKKRK